MKIPRALLSVVIALLFLARAAQGQQIEMLAAFDNNGAGGAPSVNWRGLDQRLGYEGWITLDSGSLGASARPTFDEQLGFRVDRAELLQFSLLKRLDKITPQLLGTLGSGHEIAKVEIQLVSFNLQGQPRIFARYVLGQVTVLSQTQVAQEDIVTPETTRYGETNESISLYFRSLTATYFGFNPQNGQPDPTRTVTHSYNQTIP